MSTQSTFETDARRSPVGSDNHASVRRSPFTETKNGFKTSEFYVTILFVAGVLVAAYIASGDALGRDESWMFASIVVAAYILSRGLSKLGIRQPSEDRDVRQVV